MLAVDAPGSFTRAELIEATGLSAPTIGSLTAHLIDLGLLIDLGTGPSSGGRRPSLMAFNARHGLVAGIAVGPIDTRVAVADLQGTIVDQVKLATDVDRAPAEFLAQIGATVRELVRGARIPRARLLAVGVGAPGAVDPDRGVIVGVAPNLPGWSKVPIASVLQRALGAPILAENDVNLAILGERWRGAARGHATCAFVTVGTGIGAGIVVNGELYRGHHFLAGEIALMCMGPQYVSTDFGVRGCFETLAGLRAVADRWVHQGGKTGDGWIGALFAAAAAGDSGARGIVDDTARLIGIATANVSVVIDPALVVLGGSLIVQAPMLLNEVIRTVAGIVPIPPRIVLSELHEEAPLLGGLLLATEEAKARLRRQLRGETPGLLTRAHAQ